MTAIALGRLWFGWLALPGLALGCAAPLARFEYTRPAMGTEFRVVLYARDAEHAETAAGAAFERIDALDRRLSDYDPESELSRLGARSDAGTPTEPIPLSAELFEVLAAAQELARASGGAFDVTVGPYVRLWRRARRQEELPDATRLAEAAHAVGHAKLVLEPATRTARLLAPGMRLDLGGIAKGYAADEALAELARHGCARALVAAGGDVALGAAPPGRSGWRIALVELGATVAEAGSGGLELAHAAVSTSGDLAQALELGGRRHSHILDPRTGAALVERRLVTVIAPRAMEADALATAVSVLGPADGLALVARARDAAARVTVLAGARREVFCSPTFPSALSCVDPDTRVRESRATVP